MQGYDQLKEVSLYEIWPAFLNRMEALKMHDLQKNDECVDLPYSYDSIGLDIAGNWKEANKNQWGVWVVHFFFKTLICRKQSWTSVHFWRYGQCGRVYFQKFLRIQRMPSAKAWSSGVEGQRFWTRVKESKGPGAEGIKNFTGKLATTYIA